MNLTEDWHVHSSEFSSDAHSTLAENISAALARGITTLGLADHARSESTWIVERNREVKAYSQSAGMKILLGVEVKMLRTSGELDIPSDLAGIDFILIADHKYPSATGPLEPLDVRRMMRHRLLSAKEAIDCIISAMANAVRRVAPTPYPSILAHPFSLLPKIGLSESMISSQQIELLGRAMMDRGARLEINEKWQCPSNSVISALSQQGVELVAGSDSHRASDIGVYSRDISSDVGLVV